MTRIIYVILILFIFACGCNQDQAIRDNVTIVQIHWTDHYVLFAADGYLGGEPVLPGWICSSEKRKNLYIYVATPQQSLRKLRCLKNYKKIQFANLEIDLFDDRENDPNFMISLGIIIFMTSIPRAIRHKSLRFYRMRRLILIIQIQVTFQIIYK